MLQPYQHEFIDIALASQALKFGEFTLKSGRKSPYFFNAGQFQTGEHLMALGRAYSQALVNSDVPFDMLFGPAYKGIPLATTTAIALANLHNMSLPFGYNRKEAKDHGEGGNLVGAPLSGKVAIIDDVITAGTAIREVLAMIHAANAKPAAVVVGLDRQERGQGERSAIEELEQETSVPVISIITLADITSYLKSSGDKQILTKIEQYRDKYGVNPR